MGHESRWPRAATSDLLAWNQRYLKREELRQGDECHRRLECLETQRLCWNCIAYQMFGGLVIARSGKLRTTRRVRKLTVSRCKTLPLRSAIASPFQASLTVGIRAKHHSRLKQRGIQPKRQQAEPRQEFGESERSHSGRANHRPVLKSINPGTYGRAVKSLRLLLIRILRGLPQRSDALIWGRTDARVFSYDGG